MLTIRLGAMQEKEDEPPTKARMEYLRERADKEGKTEVTPDIRWLCSVEAAPPQSHQGALCGPVANASFAALCSTRLLQHEVSGVACDDAPL